MSQNSSYFQFVQTSMYSERSLERLLEVCAKNQYSLGNCAKALSQNPNIVAFRSKDDIEKDGGRILLDAKPIDVNAPFRTPTGTRFTSVKVFDLNQTSLGIPKKNFREEDHLAIIALMARRACFEVEEHEFKPTFKQYIYFDKSCRKYWLKEGVGTDVQAMLLAKELILKKIGFENKKLKEQGKKQINENTANCIAMTAAYIVETWLGGDIKKLPTPAKQGLCHGEGFYKNLSMAHSLAKRFIKSLSQLINESRKETQHALQMR